MTQIRGLIIIVLIVSIVYRADEQKQYKCTDKPIAGISVTLENAGEIDMFTPFDVDLDYRIQRHLYGKLHENNSMFRLAMAIIGHESKYNTNAHHHNENGTIDRGLVQINSRYIDYFEDIYDMEIDPLDPYDSIDFLVAKMNDEIKYWSDKVPAKYLDYCILGSYNMGRGAYRKYIRNNGYIYTYITKVMKVYNSLQDKP